MYIFLVVVVGIFCFVLTYNIAISKNRNPLTWIFICLMGSPLCIIILVMLDDLPRQPKGKYDLPRNPKMKYDFKSTGFSFKKIEKKNDE